jgi:hypothetical protein
MRLAAAIRHALAAALVITCAAGCMPMTTTTGGKPVERAPVARDPLAGRYAINGVQTDLVVIRKLDDHRYAVENPGNWTGVGIFDGKTYWGVFRYPDDSRHGSLTRAVGIHRAERQRDGSFKVFGSFSGGGGSQGLGEFEVAWKPL